MKEKQKGDKTMFKVGDIIDVKNRRDLIAYGNIKKFIDEDGTKKAVIHFRLPREPKEFNVCDECDWPGFISVSGNTGERVCMKTGCGHGHGFEEREEIIAVDKLINISSKRKKKKLKEMKEEMDVILKQAIEDDVISQDIQKKVLELLE